MSIGIFVCHFLLRKLSWNVQSVFEMFLSCIWLSRRIISSFPIHSLYPLFADMNESCTYNDPLNSSDTICKRYIVSTRLFLKQIALCIHSTNFVYSDLRYCWYSPRFTLSWTLSAQSYVYVHECIAAQETLLSTSIISKHFARMIHSWDCKRLDVHWKKERSLQILIITIIHLSINQS